MSALERHSYLSPFPQLPNGDEPGIEGMSLRPFGLFRSDLDVDFDHDSRPQLVTRILQCCTASKDGDLPGQDFFWDLTSSKRIECLVAIATLGNPSGLPVRLRCPGE